MSPSKETYEPGTTVELKAVSATGWAFDHWEGDASGSQEEFPLIMNSDKSTVAHFKDAIAPEISKVDVSKVSYWGATIAWETDEDSAAWVEYGTSDAYGARADSQEVQTTCHSIHLTGLEPNTTYYFKVMSKDRDQNEATPVDRTFETLLAPPFGHEVGNRAPMFDPLPEYNDVRNPQSPNNGEMIDLEGFLGKKKVLLNFWLTSCRPCVLEFPFLRAIHESSDSDVAVITICLRGSADGIAKLEDKYRDEIGRFTFPILLDLEGETKRAYKVTATPKTVFVDSDGIIREIKIGRFHKTDDIQEILNGLE